MASRSSSKLARVIVVVVAVICCFMAVEAALAPDCAVSNDVDGCSYAEAASPATRHRKVLLRSATEEKKGGFEGTERLKKAKAAVAQRWKLREVPLGPDPMHHHGNPPNKSRSP